jgi:hypothetical protein
MLLLVSRWQELHSIVSLCFDLVAWHEVHSVLLTDGLESVEKCILPVAWQLPSVQLGFVPNAVWFLIDAFHDEFTISVVNALDALWQ